MSVDVGECQSVDIGWCWLMSFDVGVDVGWCLSMSVDVSRCLSMSVDVCWCLSMSVDVCWCLSISVDIGECQSVDVGWCRSMSVDVGRCRSNWVDVECCKYQSMLIDWWDVLSWIRVHKLKIAYNFTLCGLPSLDYFCSTNILITIAENTEKVEKTSRSFSTQSVDIEILTWANQQDCDKSCFFKWRPKVPRRTSNSCPQRWRALYTSYQGNRTLIFYYLFNSFCVFWCILLGRAFLLEAIRKFMRRISFS